MSLQLQVQSLTAAFLYGFFLSFAYSFVNRLFLGRRGRFLGEIIWGSLAAGGLFFSQLALNGGQLQLYTWLFFSLGVICFVGFFASRFLGLLESHIHWFNWLFFPFHFIFGSINAILRKMGVMGHGHTKKKIQKK